MVRYAEQPKGQIRGVIRGARNIQEREIDFDVNERVPMAFRVRMKKYKYVMVKCPISTHTHTRRASLYFFLTTIYFSKNLFIFYFDDIITACKISYLYNNHKRRVLCSILIYSRIIYTKSS